MDETKEVKFRVVVYATGIKKRCRKTEKHHFFLGYVDYDANLTDQRKGELLDKARDHIRTNMKEVQKASLELFRVELQGSMMSCTMFDERHKSFSIETSKLHNVLS